MAKAKFRCHISAVTLYRQTVLFGEVQIKLRSAMLGGLTEFNVIYSSLQRKDQSSVYSSSYESFIELKFSVSVKLKTNVFNA